MTTLSKTKSDAKQLYDTWRKNPSYCPAFKEKVVISLKGWRHLTGSTGNKKRIPQDVHRRLNLLSNAMVITETSTTIQNITKRHGRTYYVLEAISPVKINNKTQMKKIRVLFLEDNQKKKIFYSVMDK